ncbi:phage tail tape measure protein [Acinetobacter oleivorans]|uniref:phage tail tape measure protein n=1 Tax=Acinetobacter oleivorans TaxID=1148157 RepID=UPI00158127BF|nr:phage tail tape measure protein [Acinetobacter oleivorans]NUG01108.1 phage tail tape measure protein [Acinetobacter oleivorans]
MAKGVVRDFLVSLGFDTDNSGLASMKSAMDGIEWKAKALNGALMALATGAVVAVRQTASELDKLYFSSQRIGASVTNINAYGNAIAQLGGDAEGAIGSLETLAEKIRNSPGYEGQIKSLGVSPRDANGQMRDRVEVMKDLSGVLAKMPAYQANAYANSLGIDQKTMLAMRDGKFIANMEKYQKIQKELGMNDDLAKSGNEFMTEYRDLTMMTKTGFQVIVMQAGKALIPILRLLNQLIQAGIHAFSQLNPQIKEGLAIGLRFAMLALMFSAMAKSLGLLLKFIPALKTFIGLLKLFRLAFLASPIGIILTLGAALALLYDDYKTWREGGKSLFDWSKWTNGIDIIINKIKDFLDILDKVKDKTIEFVQKVIHDPAGALKDVATEVKQGVENAKKAVQNYVNPSDPDKVTPTQEKVAGATSYVKSAVEKGVAAAMGAAKATVEAVKGAVNNSNSNYAFSFGKKIDGYIKEASKKYGIPEDVLRGFVKMEDGWTGKMSPTGAIGAGQFTQGTWNGLAKTDAGKEIGMTKINKSNFRKASDPRRNQQINTLATGLLAKQNADLLKKHGLPLTGENLYMLHNIGPGVIPVLKGSSEVSDATMAAMKVNGWVKGMTPKSFVKYQKKRFNSHYAAANKQLDIPKNFTSSNSNIDKSFENYGPPTGNPHKSMINNSSSLSASNFTVHQTFQTDVTVNGASSPIDSANAIKRQQENSLVFMARGAKGAFIG